MNTSFLIGVSAANVVNFTTFAARASSSHLEKAGKRGWSNCLCDYFTRKSREEKRGTYKSREEGLSKCPQKDVFLRVNDYKQKRHAGQIIRDRTQGVAWLRNSICHCLGEMSLKEQVMEGVLTAFFLQLLYVFYLSPTSHVPGPWWARVTKIPLLVATFKGYRASFAHRLIEQYGPIVIIAPNQIHTSDEAAIKVIYDRKSIKTNFYANMGSWKGVKSTLGILDYDSASVTRSNLIQCFQSRNLDTLSEHIDSHIIDFVAAIRKHVKEGISTECLFWYRLLALDIVTDVLWGEQTELVTSASAGEINSLFLRRFHAFSKYNALRSFLPGLDLFVRLFGPKSWKQLRNDLTDLDLTAREALARWEASGRNKGHDKDVLSMLCNLNNHSNPSKRLPMSHIPAYLVEMLAAGSSTTSTTAALFCYEVASNPKFQSKLRKELINAFPDPGNIDMKTSQKLPLLRSAVRETMRVYPVIPGPLERYIGTAVSVQGKSIRPGTIASGSAYTQARLKEVFPDSEAWLPSRWLDGDEESLERMNQNWLPFGQGSRACPGSNLALNELHFMLAAVFRNFEAHPAEGKGQESYAGRRVPLFDHFTSAPKSGHIWVRFVEGTELC